MTMLYISIHSFTESQPQKRIEDLDRSEPTYIDVISITGEGDEENCPLVMHDSEDDKIEELESKKDMAVK